jgi:pyruvate kinase
MSNFSIVRTWFDPGDVEYIQEINDVTREKMREHNQKIGVMALDGKEPKIPKILTLAKTKNTDAASGSIISQMHFVCCDAELLVKIVNQTKEEKKVKLND